MRQKSVAVQSNIDGLLLDKAVEYFGEECERRWGELATSVKSPRSIGRAFKRLAEDLEFVERQTQGDFDAATSAPAKVRKVARLSALMEQSVASMREEHEIQLEELRLENTELRRALAEAVQDAANAQEMHAGQISELRARNAALIEQLSRWCAAGSDMTANGSAAAPATTSTPPTCATASGTTGAMSTDVASATCATSLDGLGEAPKTLTMEAKMKLLQHAHATRLNELQSQNAQLAERLETKDLLISKKDELLGRMRADSGAASAELQQDAGCSGLVVATAHESARVLPMQQISGEIMRSEPASGTFTEASLTQDLGRSSFAAGLTHNLASALSLRVANSSGRLAQSHSTPGFTTCSQLEQDAGTSLLSMGSINEPAGTDSARLGPSQLQTPQSHFALASCEFVPSSRHMSCNNSAAVAEGLSSTSATQSRQGGSSETQWCEVSSASPKTNLEMSQVQFSSHAPSVQRVWSTSISQLVEDGSLHPNPKQEICLHAPEATAQLTNPIALCAQLKLWTPAHCESPQTQQAQAQEMIDLLQAKLLEMNTFVQNSTSVKDSAPSLPGAHRASPADDSRTSLLPVFTAGRDNLEGEFTEKNAEEAGNFCKPEQSACERGRPAGKGRPPRPALTLTPLASGWSARDVDVRSSQRGRSFDRCSAQDFECEDISICSTRSGISSVDGTSSGSEPYSARRVSKTSSTPPLLPPIKPRGSSQDRRGSRVPEDLDGTSISGAGNSEAQSKRKLSWVRGWQPEPPDAASARQRSAGPDLETSSASVQHRPLRCPPASARASSERVLVRIVSESGIRCYDELPKAKASDSRGGQNITS